MKPNAKPLEKERNEGEDEDEGMTPNECDVSPSAPLEDQRMELADDPENPF
jgi:hypothetical protein